MTENEVACCKAPEPVHYNDTAVLHLARLCHEINRALCAVHNDHSQPEWDAAPEWQRDSSIAGVRDHLENPFTRNSRDSHDRWLERKLREGWRYGPIKDPELKRHPCLLPYHALGGVDKMKDDIFRAVIRSWMDHCMSASDVGRPA